MLSSRVPQGRVLQIPGTVSADKKRWMLEARESTAEVKRKSRGDYCRISRVEQVYERAAILSGRALILGQRRRRRVHNRTILLALVGCGRATAWRSRA